VAHSELTEVVAIAPKPAPSLTAGGGGTGGAPSGTPVVDSPVKLALVREEGVTSTTDLQRCAIDDDASCEDIDGATGETYEPVAADEGHFLHARVVAVSAEGVTTTAYTVRSARVAGVPVAAPADEETVEPVATPAAAPAPVAAAPAPVAAPAPAAVSGPCVIAARTCGTEARAPAPAYAARP
jgi:2-oxoglutarate dehydrogenase E2 component (dihydrolipoamide succinyltransferase)